MTQPVALFGQMCSGHGRYPPRPNAQASPDVFVNNLGVQRLSDTYIPHCTPGDGCHGAVVASGSSNIFVNGLPIARMGDALSCPSVIAGGSQDVFAGG